MSQPCAVEKCTRTSRGLCDCCQQQLCLQHLSEHNESLIAQLNPLTDEINALGDRLHTLNVQQIVGRNRQELEQWRSKSHQQIDRLFEQKCQELDSLVDQKVQKQREELKQVQVKVAEFIRDQEATRRDIDSLISTLDHLKKQMDKIEQTSLRITTRPVKVDNALISIRETSERELDLSNLPPPSKTITRSAGGQLAISANDRFLLMHQKPNLCLADKEMNIVKDVVWNYGNIYDMCWCSGLDRFIVNEGKNIFLVDENTLMIEKVQTIEERSWSSCTTSEISLYLATNTTGSSVMKYSLLPSINLVMEWKSPYTCAKDEVVYGIQYSNETLGLLVNNRSEKSLRMELRAAETLDRIWSLQFDTLCEKKVLFRCCSLTGGEWLVADYETKRLLQITKDGKLKLTIPYDVEPRAATLFENMLVVSTNGPINFHKLCY